jgi:hypothetical protein
MTVDDAEFICRLIQNFFLPIDLQETIPNKLEEKNFTVEVMRAAPGDLPKVESRTFDVTTGQLLTSNRSTYSLMVFLIHFFVRKVTHCKLSTVILIVYLSYSLMVF